MLAAPANIAEGFGRFYPSATLPYVPIALGSLNETVNHLLDGAKQGYLTEGEHLRLKRLALRAIKALKRWMEYLDGAAGRRFNKPKRR